MASISVPAGMESNSDSDDCMIVHHSAPLDRSGSSKLPFEKNIVSSDKKIAGNVKPYFSHVPNGNIKQNARQASVNHSYQHNKNLTSKYNQRNTVQRRQQNRSVDRETLQFFDDFRFAVMHGNLELVSFFIEKGIPVDSVLKAGWTALLYACSCGHHEIVKYLLEKKADPNFSKDSFTPLMAVCASSQDETSLVKCVQQLMEHGADVNAQERHLTTPLMFASREGHVDVAKELLKHNVELNVHDNRGRTALHWASSYGYGQIVRLLLCKGADPDKVTFGGQSAHDLAYDEGHKEVASLLQKGVNQLVGGTDHVGTDEEKENTVKNAQPSPEPRNSYMSAKEYNALRKSFRPLEKTKCYVKQSELDLFLTGLGLSDLVPVINEQQVAFSDLLIMTEEDLEKIGVQQFGARKKILEATKAVHKKEWEASSLPDLKQYQYISCPDAVTMVANIAHHLKYISSSVIYVRQQIQAHPRILELGQDSSNVHDLIDETQEGLKNVQVLYDELRFLKLHLDKVQDNVNYIPADLIVETVPKSKSRWKGAKIVVVLTVITLTVGRVLWKKHNSLSALVPFSFFGKN